MDKLEKDWVKRPVLHIDLNAQKYDTPESLKHILHATLSEWEKIYGAQASEIGLSLRFQGIIRRAYEKTGHRVVILVDEYDKPMLQAIGNEELQKSFRDTLQAFLRCAEKYGRLHKVRVADGSYQIWQSECVQRFE